MIDSSDDLFEKLKAFPDPAAKRRFNSLVGLDDAKARLLKEARLMLNPALLENWSYDHHNCVLPLVRIFRTRPPLLIFAGDVGTGKTALAETFGDALARANDVPVYLYRLSLTARGSGAVGQMTRLISTAFATVEAVARPASHPDQKGRLAVILVIDEADALVQSRELVQMHHEDRAGVNTIIRGVDRLAADELPVLVVMCTNRPESIDPAVVRRAALVIQFERPTLDQRVALLRESLQGLALADQQLLSLAEAMAEQPGRPYGFTYSDIVQRFIPLAILDAFPDSPLTFDQLMAVASSVTPTPPFKGDAS